MENDIKNTLANIMKACYASGMSYSEATNIINRTFLLSKEDLILCEGVWKGCVNTEEAE